MSYFWYCSADRKITRSQQNLISATWNMWFIRNHFWFFIFLVTLATGFVSFSICYHFLCKMFTNFSPRRHVNDFKGTYFVKKINIYQIKNIFVFASKDPRIEEFISSAAHFSFQYNLQILKYHQYCSCLLQTETDTSSIF